MRITNIRKVGRFKNLETEQEYNVYKGQRTSRSTTHYFYLYRNKRILIPDSEYFNNHTKTPNQKKLGANPNHFNMLNL